MYVDRETYSDIREVVTTIVHNHVNAAMPANVDTHSMSIEKAKLHKEHEGQRNTQGDEHPGEQH